MVVDRVSQARRDGDSAPDKAIIADTMKLLGNSAYGKTVTDQLKHGVMYEADMFKSAINLTLPLQIDFFVYQYAKLRMLEFYF